MNLLFFSLVGDILLSSAFLSYSGPFNQDFRVILSDGWVKETKQCRIPFTTDLNVTNMLTDPATVSSPVLYQPYWRNFNCDVVFLCFFSALLYKPIVTSLTAACC